MSGVSQAFISEVERGLVAISSEKLVLIAKALEVSVEMLVSQDQELRQPPRPTAAVESGVRVPVGLISVAEEFQLSLNVVRQLLDSSRALAARRTSDSSPVERTAAEWRKFYLAVKDYLDED